MKVIRRLNDLFWNLQSYQAVADDLVLTHVHLAIPDLILKQLDQVVESCIRVAIFDHFFEQIAQLIGRFGVEDV